MGYDSVDDTCRYYRCSLSCSTVSGQGERHSLSELAHYCFGSAPGVALISAFIVAW